jgi:hypothetical protein
MGEVVIDANTLWPLLLILTNYFPNGFAPIASVGSFSSIRCQPEFVNNRLNAIVRSSLEFTISLDSSKYLPGRLT